MTSSRVPSFCPARPRLGNCFSERAALLEFPNGRLSERWVMLLVDNRKCPASPQLQQGPSGCASRLEHPLNAGVHFFLFDKLASCNLVDANLNLCLEPFVMSKQLGNRFLYQLVGSPSCLCGKLIQLDFLILRQIYFHIPKRKDGGGLCQARPRVVGGEAALSCPAGFGCADWWLLSRRRDYAAPRPLKYPCR
jgi:hypothetical protein